MVRKLLPIATAAALAALVVGGISGAAGSGASTARHFTLIEITVDETFVDVDNSQSAPTVGDEFIFKNRLKNRSETRTVGSDTGICTFTSVSEQDFTVHCIVTVSLHGDTLEANALISGSTFKAAITGGTGRYDKARGQVFGRDLGENKTQLRFDID
jgi:hypothetical protein